MPPLEGKIALITRSRNQSPDEIALLEDNGATVIALPTIKAVAVKDNSPIDNEISRLKEYDYLVFSSKNSVKFFNARMNLLGAVLPESVKVICVGSKTAEYAVENNIRVDIIPDEFSASGILNKLENDIVSGKKFLLPSSAIARDELSTGLGSLNALVSSIPVYNIVMPKEDEIKEELMLLKKRKPDVFIFTSPSSFRNYLTLVDINNPGEYFTDRITVAIGNTTKNEIFKNNTEVDLVPDEFTIESSIEEVIKYYKTVKSVEL